jgi:hypothetical protein
MAVRPDWVKNDGVEFCLMNNCTGKYSLFHCQSSTRTTDLWYERTLPGIPAAVMYQIWLIG